VINSGSEAKVHEKGKDSDRSNEKSEKGARIERRDAMCNEKRPSAEEKDDRFDRVEKQPNEKKDEKRNRIDENFEKRDEKGDRKYYEREKEKGESRDDKLRKTEEKSEKTAKKDENRLERKDEARVRQEDKKKGQFEGREKKRDLRLELMGREKNKKDRGNKRDYYRDNLAKMSSYSDRIFRDLEKRKDRGESLSKAGGKEVLESAPNSHERDRRTRREGASETQGSKRDERSRSNSVHSERSSNGREERGSKPTDLRILLSRLESRGKSAELEKMDVEREKKDASLGSLVERSESEFSRDISLPRPDPIAKTSASGHSPRRDSIPQHLPSASPFLRQFASPTPLVLSGQTSLIQSNLQLSSLLGSIDGDYDDEYNVPPSDPEDPGLVTAAVVIKAHKRRMRKRLAMTPEARATEENSFLSQRRVDGTDGELRVEREWSDGKVSDGVPRAPQDSHPFGVFENHLTESERKEQARRNEEEAIGRRKRKEGDMFLQFGTCI
jgi:hypothetical protein